MRTDIQVNAVTPFFDPSTAEAAGQRLRLEGFSSILAPRSIGLL
jgi:hypothetical protein